MANNPVTLITGTRKGIGQYLAKYYIEKGHIVVGCSRREFDSELPNYHHICADVSNEKEVKQVFKFIRKDLGLLTNLLNNAGIASMNHTLITPLSSVHNILDTNVIGTFLFCREAAKLMQKNKYGRIVNFTTVATPLKLEGEAIYAASKAAILSLTQIMAREFAELGITVNAIGPTPIKTDLVKNVAPEKMESLISRQAITRYGTFEDVINVIDFYLRKESDFITGQNIFLGGI